MWERLSLLLHNLHPNLYRMKTFTKNQTLPKCLSALLFVLMFTSGMAYSQFSVTIKTLPASDPPTVCQNSSLVLKAYPTGGVTPYGPYTWGGAPFITPAGDIAVLTPDETTTPGIYTISCTVKDHVGNEVTGYIDITVYESPTASITNNGTTTFCQGGSVELEAYSEAGYSFQWRRDDADISGATSSTYNATVSGSYNVVVTNGNGCDSYSNYIYVTVNPLPSATASNDGPACYNGTINLTSGPNGMVSYSWTSTSTTPFSSTLQNPSITNVTPDNSGDYTVIVTDANGCENSATTTVLVYANLNGGTVGSDQTICYNGDPASFSNIASPSGGDGVWTYGWEYKVGAGPWNSISGATGLTYDVPAGLTQTTQYRRVATNGCGTVYSNTITVTVYADLNGGLISSSQSICYNGDPAAFSNDAAASGGDGTFTYSWESKVGAGLWTPILGATGLTYDVPAGLTQTTLYRRKATNTCGVAYSNELTVTVFGALSGGVVAADQSICYSGDPAAFTNVTSPAGGTGAWTYSWESKVGAGAWTPIGGASGLTYDVPAGLTQTTMYRRAATNACGTVYSNVLTITVYAQMNGGVISGNQSLCYNSDPSPITSTTNPSGGNGTWSYSWEYQSNCTGVWQAISGATALTYDPPAGQTETRCYRRVATNSCGTVYSNTITITIYADINGGTIASDQTVCYGADPAAFTSSSAASGGNGAFTYFWEMNTGSGWSAITGENGLTYNPPAGITQTTTYRRGATNSCGTGYSNTLTVTVSNAINGGQISTPSAVCYNGDPAAFTNVASPSGGSGVWVYSWEYKEGAGPWIVIPGEVGLTYDIPAGQTTTRTYRRVATNDCGTGYSNEVTITVYPNTAAGSITGNQTLCYNSDPLAIASVTLPTGGDGVWAYSWEYQSNCAGPWILIPGATGQTYDPPAGQTETRCYRRVETNTCGVLYSNIITITIIPEIANNTISANQTICFGSVPVSLTGSLPTGGSGIFSYQWQSSTVGATGPFSNIPGATSQNYSPTALSQNTWYRRVVTSSSCVSFSNVVAITVLPSVSNNTIAADQTICYNTTPELLTGSIPTGGNGTYSYQWQSSTTGAAGPFFDISGANAESYQPGSLTADTWFRRAVSSGPCTDYFSNVVKITVNAEFSVLGFSLSSPTCNGYSNGSATVNLSGGAPPFSYSWNTTPEQTTQTATGLSAGVSYSVTITDNLGCEAAGNVTLTQPDAIGLASKTVTPVTGCNGNSNGSIEALGSGGTPDYTYSLYDGPSLIGTQSPSYPTPASFASLPASTYTLSITDANSCPAYTEDIVINEPDPIIITDVSTVPISCFGAADGVITITASGGTGSLDYSIDNGVTFQASNTFTVGGGYYDVVVRDANGCTASWPATIEMVEPSEISFTFQVTPISSCYGDHNGEILISNVAGGSGTGYEFSIYVPEVWGSDPHFTGLPGGPANPYYIKVRDSHGCISVANNGNPIYISQPTPIAFTVNTTDVTGCWYNTNGKIWVTGVSGGTGSKTVSIDGISYFPTTHTFNVGVGSYTVYVKDSKGCIVTKPAVISGPPEIVIDNLTVTDASCFGAADGEVSAIASGGTGTLDYSIDGITYQATGDFSGLTADTYTLYVRDANGCVLTQEFTVGQPDALYFTTRVKTDISCFGANDGTITLEVAGGTPPYNYSITGGAPFGNATGLFTGLSANTYIPAVLDANGCSVIGMSLTIVEPALLAISSQTSTNITCFGANDGTITVEATGGTAPLTFSLLDASLIVIATNETGLFTNLAPGTYTVEVNDANSCGPVSAGPFIITEPSQLTFTYSVVDLVCNGDANGQITINASGGTPPYDYSYDGGLNFEVNNVKNGLSGGDYTVVVRDAKGCTDTQVVSVYEPAPIILSLATSNISCGGLTDGSIDASATGGTLPYQYRIDGGAWQPTGSFTGLSASTYLVEVIDASGCITGENATITEPPAIVISSVTPVNPTCTTTGSITVTASGGTGILTYTLMPDNVSNTSGLFMGLGAGTYTVDVTDANGCGPVSTAPITLTSPSTISIDNVIVTHVTGCYGDTNGSLEIIASGGTPPLVYSIDGGATYNPTNIFINLPANDYSIVVNDVNGCLQSTLRTINQPAQITIDNVVVVQESTPGANDGEIHVTATGGTGALTYTLQPNGISNGTGNFTGLGTGTYHVDVMDANGCMVQTGDLIISGVNINITSNNVSCHGGSDGLITITITGGFPPFTVVCNEIDTTPIPVNDLGGGVFSAEGLSAGSYLITVTDNVPHTFPTYQIDILEPDSLIATFVSLQNPQCHGGADGSVLFNITGGTPVYTITWDGGTSVGTTATPVTAGYHEFTITDQHGCSTVVSDVPELVEPNPIQLVEQTQFDPTCHGEAIGIISVTATGGTGTLTYNLSGTATLSNTTGVFENLFAGVYDLSVTDDNGCPDNFDPPVRFTLNEPPQIIISGLTPDDSLICPNDPSGFVRVQVSGGQPDYTYLWSNGQTTVDLDSVVVGDYTITVTDALNCRVSQTFTVRGTPMLDLNPVVIDTALCRIKPTGNTGRIDIRNSTGGNGQFADLEFQWNDANATTGPTLPKAGDPMIIGGGIYTVTVKDTSGCVYSFDYEVPINPRYNFLTNAGSDTTVCYSNPVILHGSVISGNEGGTVDTTFDFSYEWRKFPDIDGDPIHRGQDYQVNLVESSSFLLWAIENNSGCKDSTRINLNVLPKIGLEVPLYISAVQDTIISILTGKEVNLDVITRSVEYATEFQWKPAEMFNPPDSWNSSILINDQIKQQIPEERKQKLTDPISKKPTDFILVDVIATTEMGCTDSLRLYTKEVTSLGFANVFSPNGDGINDVWGVPKDYLFPDLSIEIFNRWGSLVWSATGDKAAKGWNGRTSNGNELPIGTYYYIVKFNVQAQGASWKPITGSVTIVK